MFLKFIKKKNYLQITKKQLLNFSIFLGHSKKKWCKNYTVFIFGFRNNLILINLDYIFYMVTRSLVFIQLLIKFYGNICALSNFVNYNFCGLTQFFLERNFYSFYDGRYIGGLVSNIFHIKNTKKKMLYDFFMNINKLRLLPSCFLIFDSNIFYSCFNEAAFLGIPSIGFLDTDLNFTNCLYPIVGNNESLFIYFYYLIILVFLRKKNVVSRKLKFFNFLLYIYIYILKYKFYFILINFSKNNVKFINFFKFCFFKYKITFNFFLRKFFFYQNTLYAIDLVIRMLKITIYARIIFLLKFLKKFKNKRFLKKKFIMFFLKSLKFFFAFKYDNYLMQKKKFKSKNFLVIKNNNKRLRLLFKKKYFYSFKLYIKLVSFFYAKKLFFLSLRKIFKLKTKFSFLYRLKYTFILQKLVSFYKKKIFLLDNFFYLTKKFKTSTALFRLNHLKRLKNKKKLFLKKNNFKIKKTKKFNFKFTLKKKRKILKYFNKLKKNSQFNFLNLKLVSNKYFIKFFTFFFFKKKFFKM